jgi:hypothetical protein
VSGSSARTQTTQQQTTNTQNLNLQDTSGVTLANSYGNTISTTDFGAIDAAADISHQAISLGRDALASNESIAYAGLDTALRAQQSGLDFAGDVTSRAFNETSAASDRVARFAVDALDSNSSLSRDVLASQSDLATKALTALSDAGAGILDFASNLFNDSLNAQSALADQNIQGLTTLAAQNTATSDDRFVKLVTVVAIAAAAIFIIPRFVK